MTAVLVGPLQRVTFADGTTEYHDMPRDTLDIRYSACGNHHLACDCREASFAEECSELRGDLRYIDRAFSEVLDGHLTRARPGEVACMCTGCRIARRGGRRYAESCDVRDAARRLARSRYSDIEDVPF